MLLNTSIKSKALFLILIFSLNIIPNYRFLNPDIFSDELFEYTILKNVGSDYFEGYNLFVVERHSTPGWVILNRTMFITDTDGRIYFEREMLTDGALADNAAEFINSTTILYAELGHAKLWNLETNTTTHLNFSGHHDIERNYANNTYFVLKGYVIKIGGEEYLYDKIQEYTPGGNLVWEVDTIDFVNESQWCPFEDMESGIRDITHANSIIYDEKEDAVYLNSRNLNTFYKIDHKTGEVVWGLGEYGNFTMYDINGIQQEIMFYHGHDLEKISDNKFTYFDNDYHNQTDASNFHSRLIEITISETTKTANITWEWISPQDYFSGWWGDCDVLPNNNMLGVFGATDHINTDLGARLVEVNREHEIVWEFAFPKVGTDIFGVYNMERVRFAPVVSDPQFIETINSTYLEWDIWYNFKSKTDFTGTYYINIDEVTVETGQIILPRFWQSVQIQYSVDEITAGTHNISLIVSDEAGHLSNESEKFSSTGSLIFKDINNKALVLGLSLGISGFILASGGIFVWFKFLKKKQIFKKLLQKT
jgi:hypothetical protein